MRFRTSNAAQVGWEFSNWSRWFGFTIGIRPWLDILRASGTVSKTAIGFGITGEIGFHFHIIMR